MKAFWLTKNRRRRRGAPRLSLFPFLAVLICTMGALVLLLLSVTRQARLQAGRQAAANDAERKSSIAAEMEMVQWRVDQLKKSRQETEAQLADSRLVLGHIEDHGRRLRDQFQELSRQAKKAADEGLKAGRFVAAGEEELRQLEDRIAEASRRLAQARQAAADRPKSFAIVPYDGPNHTRRRPIYIECRGDAVVLQPENIVFKEADFDEPLGPGNPLAAAVRAAREQMLLERSVDPQNSGEPYPLLLVRPAGIAAYAAALSAMESWGSEFGYELIDDDWQLKYPPPDPNLARSIDQAVALARQEHARLIAAAPSQYGKRPRAGSFRTSAGDGADGQGRAGGGGSGGGGGSPGFYSSRPARRYAGGSAGNGSSTSGGGGFGGFGDGGDSPPGGGVGGGSGRPGGMHAGSAVDSDAEFVANNPYASLPTPGMIPGGAGNGSQFPAPGAQVPPPNSGYGPGYAATGAPGPGFAGGMAGPPGMLPGGNGNGSQFAGPNSQPPAPNSGYGTGYATSGAPGPGLPSDMGNGSPLPAPGSQPIAPGSQFAAAGSPLPAFGSPLPANGQPVASSPAAAGIARPDGYIEGRPDDGNPPPVRPNPASSAAMVPVAPLRPGEWREEITPPKPDPAEEEKEKNEKKKHPYDKVNLDHDRDDWALRNATRHSAAISRPVHVDCYPDRLVLMPEAGAPGTPGRGEPRVVFFEDRGRRDADRLVAGVWEIMDTWGMAGREMYWRPVLKFYVAPGAEPRMLDLTRSLQGSGLVIERKQ